MILHFYKKLTIVLIICSICIIWFGGNDHPSVHYGAGVFLDTLGKLLQHRFLQSNESSDFAPPLGSEKVVLYGGHDTTLVSILGSLGVWDKELVKFMKGF